MTANSLSPSTQKGFSLLELLTVLVMLGIVAGISAPAIGKLLSGLDFRKQVQNISANLRAVRLQAIVTGRDIVVRLDEGNLLLQSGRDEPQVKELDLNEESEILMEPEVIIFTPQSTATPAVLTYARGERSREIKLDPLTALPVIQ
ncbi:MAG: prepilin-type N-terminal cleavage/methylation domain-containing protein [Desulfobulbaceae bacterium]|nr:prepilin-type N-terminal cleavage/methylation domain-containing protein [Desulfobulbaceae bacterium]